MTYDFSPSDPDQLQGKMFVVAEMQDTVRIEPHRFAQDTGQELSDELNKKFANKV